MICCQIVCIIMGRLFTSLFVIILCLSNKEFRISIEVTLRIFPAITNIFSSKANHSNSMVYLVFGSILSNRFDKICSCGLQPLQAIACHRARLVQHQDNIQGGRLRGSCHCTSNIGLHVDGSLAVPVLLRGRGLDHLDTVIAVRLHGSHWIVFARCQRRHRYQRKHHCQR